MTKCRCQDCTKEWTPSCPFCASTNTRGANAERIKTNAGRIRDLAYLLREQPAYADELRKIADELEVP